MKKDQLKFAIRTQINKSKFFIILFSCLFIISGCTTRYKKASQLMADKNYEEALLLLDTLILEDPSDADYRVAQKQARIGLIDKNLIQVRHSRLAQNFKESLDILKSTIEKENQWNLFPSGAVAFTQSEEVDEAYKFLVSEVNQLDRNKKPIRILYLIKHYKILFSESHSKKLNQYYAEAEKDTQDICQHLTQQTRKNLYFYTKFVGKLCGYVKKTNLNLPQPSIPLYKNIILTASSVTHQNLKSNIQELLNSKLKPSGWLLNESTDELNFKSDLSFNLFERKHTERRQSQYTEYIQETHRETVTETNINTGKLETITRPVTKNVPHDRTYWYYVNIIDQTCNSQVKINKNNVMSSDYVFNFSDNASREFNTISLPQYNVQPYSRGEEFNESQWINKISLNVVSEIRKKLENEFNDRYCLTLNENQKTSESINQALLCAQQVSLNETLKPVPQNIEHLFDKNFNVSFTEMNSLFELREP